MASNQLPMDAAASPYSDRPGEKRDWFLFVNVCLVNLAVPKVTKGRASPRATATVSVALVMAAGSGALYEAVADMAIRCSEGVGVVYSNVDAMNQFGH
ncbi:hypothetical protein FALBO_7736 [Fusarium albosuccineum]|uniref:Uncharacterized protein n=1 Tax=Fusarium albosuccineum TaxID=1237068 RepID=A0A8H4PAJ7_9HYPO|nr:hypothetical protein FALBO_7736 [Fusarium albosuccineum]